MKNCKNTFYVEIRVPNWLDGYHSGIDHIISINTLLAGKITHINFPVLSLPYRFHFPTQKWTSEWFQKKHLGHYDFGQLFGGFWPSQFII